MRMDSLLVSQATFAKRRRKKHSRFESDARMLSLEEAVNSIRALTLLVLLADRILEETE